MLDFEVLEPAIDPGNKISFLLDWELTLKCNLDCSYCIEGHDNSTKHPPMSECLDALDFMFKYVDLYMNTKPKGIRYVVLNVYGGESLHHPDIIEILSQIKDFYRPYADRWHLTVTTTTNAIVTNKKLKQIIPYIDEFTVTYHAENTTKQQNQFKENILTIAQSAVRLKCIVMMHNEPELFKDCEMILNWLTSNNIKSLPKQVDTSVMAEPRLYDTSQITWFNSLYQKNSYNISNTVSTDISTNKSQDLSDAGRACCGGRQVCGDQNYKQRHFYVDNKFPDWYCSVNHFFLFVRQVTGEIFVNKDCKMNFDGSVGPIGILTDSKNILANLHNQLDTGSMPVIQCKKYKCQCGLCAPKAKNLDTYKSIMKKYQKDYVI